MMVGRRFGAWWVRHDDGEHALTFGVWDYVLEDRFHLLHILRKRGRKPERYCGQHQTEVVLSHVSRHCLSPRALKHDNCFTFTLVNRIGERRVRDQVVRTGALKPGQEMFTNTGIHGSVSRGGL